MNKLIVLQGIPASGKSAWAIQWAKEYPNSRVVVNRDSLRSMLGEYWVPEREKLVTTLEEACIVESLESGYEVCIDATNLNPKTISKWEDIAKYMEVDIEFKEFLISVEEAIARDKGRALEVGEKTIKNFYEKYYKNPGEIPS